jgi:hypothetical protein
LSEIKDLFVDEIAEGVFWHEMGHLTVYDHILSPDHIGLGKTFHAMSDHSVVIFNELLADWAPERNGIHGPLSFFLKLADENREKAERMLCVYLSDNWFLGDESVHSLLQDQTDFLVSALLPFWEKEGFDFSRFAEARAGLYEQFLQLNTEYLDSVTACLQGAVCHVNGATYGFDALDRRIRQIINFPLCKIHWENKGKGAYSIYYWSNVVDWVRRYSPETFEEIRRLGEQSVEDIKKRFLKILVGSDTASAYGNNLRVYLVERMKDLGFIL